MVGALFAYLNWTAHQERAAKRRSHAMGIIAPGAVNSTTCKFKQQQQQ
jgi:hypothetical protein